MEEKKPIVGYERPLVGNVEKNAFVEPEVLYARLVETLRKYRPATDLSVIEKAYRVADEAHKGQLVDYPTFEKFIRRG